MRKLALVALLPFLAAATTGNPSGPAVQSPSVAQCANATYAVTDPNGGTDANTLTQWAVAVGNTAFTQTNANVATAAFGEIYDSNTCWSRSGTGLVFQYSCSPDITVKLTIWADVQATMDAAEDQFVRTELHPAKDDEGTTIGSGEARTQAAVLFTGPTALVTAYQYGFMHISDSIPVDTSDSVGFFLELADPGAQLFTINVHNLLVTIEQVSPLCY